MNNNILENLTAPKDLIFLKESKQKKLMIALYLNKTTITFENVKELYENERYYLQIKNNILNNKPILQVNSLLLENISNLSVLYSSIKQEEVDTLLLKLFNNLEIWKINGSAIIRFLLAFQNETIINNIIKLHHDKIEKELSRVIIDTASNYEFDSDGDLLQDGELLLYNINESKNITSLQILIENYFIQLAQNKNFLFTYSSFFYNSKTKEISSFGKQLLQNKKQYPLEFIMTLIRFVIHKTFLPFIDDAEIIVSNQSIERILLNNIDMYNKKDFEILLKALENIKSSKTDDKSLFPNSFFHQLKHLKKLYKNNTEIKTLPIYHTCLNAYKYIIKKKLSINTTEYDKTLDQLFNKMIKRNSICDFFYFEDINSIIHYNRTNISGINGKNFLIKDLLSYPVKELNTLLNISNQKNNNIIEHKIFNNEKDKINDINTNETILKMLLLFNFENSIKLLKIYSINDINQIMKFFNIDMSKENYSNKNKDYINFILKKRLIFDPTNLFFLKQDAIYCYYIFKNMYNREPSVRELKNMYEANSIKLSNRAQPLVQYFSLIQSKNINIKEYISNSIKLYYAYQEKYKSTIPNISGNYNEYYYETVSFTKKALFYGNEIDCCMTVLGKANNSLDHALTNKNGRLFRISKDNRTIALSWIWRNQNILCFDNIEVKREDINNTTLTKILYHIYMKAAIELQKISQQNEPFKESIQIVTLGRNSNDILIPQLENLKKIPTDILKQFSPQEQGLYLDSIYKQYILTGNINNIFQNSKNTTQYYMKRNSPIPFRNINASILGKMIDAIRERANLTPSNTGYLDGFINDDYYIGIKSTLEIDIVKCGTDNRKNNEIKNLLKLIKNMIIKYNENKIKREALEKKLNNDYQITDLNLYLKEKKILENYVLNKNFYFHGTNLKQLISILNDKEISCNFRRGTLGGGSNGAFHICITKKLDNIQKKHCFDTYVKNGISIIIEESIKPFFSKINDTADIEDNNIRLTNYSDEYQVSDTIPFKQFKAINVPQNHFKDARIISEVLESLGIDLPIVDIENEKVLSKEFIYKYTKKNQ